MSRIFWFFFVCGFVLVVLFSSNVLFSNDIFIENEIKKEEEYYVFIYLVIIKFDYVK